MRLVRGELTRLSHEIDPTAVTPGRLKRFQSIRRKLQQRLLTLYRVQDIAGVRAVVTTPEHVDVLCQLYRESQSKQK